MRGIYYTNTIVSSLPFKTAWARSWANIRKNKQFRNLGISLFFFFTLSILYTRLPAVVVVSNTFTAVCEREKHWLITKVLHTKRGFNSMINVVVVVDLLNWISPRTQYIHSDVLPHTPHSISCRLLYVLIYVYNIYELVYELKTLFLQSGRSTSAHRQGSPSEAFFWRRILDPTRPSYPLFFETLASEPKTCAWS
jgi:hypothetical protein